MRHSSKNNSVVSRSGYVVNKNFDICIFLWPSLLPSIWGQITTNADLYERWYFITLLEGVSLLRFKYPATLQKLYWKCNYKLHSPKLVFEQNILFSRYKNTSKEF